jgi:hypothetical protein
MLQARNAYFILIWKAMEAHGIDSEIILKRIVGKCIVGTLTGLQQFV